MYIPAHFVETDADEINALIDAFPLAVLVAQTAAGMVANHIPLLRHGDGHLVGHIALANDLHQNLQSGDEVLMIFTGENAYISPNWYPTKPLHHKHVPTWNYQAVHIHGTIVFHHDEKSKAAIVGRLTTRHEQLLSKNTGEAAWKMADAPKEYMQAMLKNIVAFDISITKILAKSKLSQNRDAVDFDNVITKLEASGAPYLAKTMRRWPKP